MPTPIFKRILLKLSGEALAADQGFGVDTKRIHEIAAELADVHSLDIQLAIVVGGGNFFRGVADQAKALAERLKLVAAVKVAGIHSIAKGKPLAASWAK